jgi:hypothetical protein
MSHLSDSDTVGISLPFPGGEIYYGPGKFEIVDNGKFKWHYTSQEPKYLSLQYWMRKKLAVDGTKIRSAAECTPAKFKERAAGYLLQAKQTWGFKDIEYQKYKAEQGLWRYYCRYRYLMF